jgi:hypothetical protein
MFPRNHHHQGTHYMSLQKLQYIKFKLKYIGVVDLVVWLHKLPCPCGVCLPQSSETDWSGYKKY